MFKSPVVGYLYRQEDTTMAKVGDRFKTGQKCETSGSYVWDGYDDGTTTPAPTAEERVIPMKAGETFPPVKSAKKGAWWKLQRIA
jgi:hypothetical protein